MCGSGGDTGVDTGVWQCWRCVAVLAMCGSAGDVWQCWRCVAVLAMCGSAGDVWQWWVSMH